MSSDGERRITGYRQQQTEKKEERPPVDEDQFKRVMEKDESQKKKKRQPQEEDTIQEGLAIAKTAIRANLKHESLYEVQSPQPMKKQTYQGQKNAKMEFLATPETPEAHTPTPTPTIEPASPFVPPTPQEPIPTPPSTQAPTVEPTHTETAKEQTQSEQEPEKAAPEEARVNTTKPEKLETAKSTKPELTPQKTEKPPEKTKQAEKSATKQTTAPEKPKEETQPPKPVTPEKAPPTERVTAETTTQIQKEKHKQSEKEKAAAIDPTTTVTTQHPAGVAPITPPTPITGASPVNLPPTVFALFDKMVSYITIEQSKSGTQTTTIHIDMKGSAFNGATLKLERFATAADTFNIQLESPNPEAVNLFNDNVDQLAAAFQYGHYAFKVNIKRATHATTKPKIQRIKPKKSDKET